MSFMLSLKSVLICVLFIMLKSSLFRYEVTRIAFILADGCRALMPNSAYQDKMSHIATSHLGLRCLLTLQL